MAKRDPRHPALRGYQVWRWMERGILKAGRLHGAAGVLVVQKAVRVRLDRKYRTTISQGIFLVPRWIPMPKNESEKFSLLSEEKLRKNGIIKVEDRPYLLIYQQIEDLAHLYRQQEHILLDGVQMRIFNLKVKPHIVARKKAAAKLAKQRAKQLRDIQEGKVIPLLKRLATPEEIPDWEIEGMVNYLDGVIAELEQIIERPFVVGRKRAQGSLRAVQRQLRKRNFYLARKRLMKALENLIWPKENR